VLHPDEYRRLHAACLTMALQSDLPNVQNRWLALAQACSSIAVEEATGPHARKRVGDRPKSILARVNSRVAVVLCASPDPALFFAESVSAFL
jgi:hypothetical protein